MLAEEDSTQSYTSTSIQQKMRSISSVCHHVSALEKTHHAPIADLRELEAEGRGGDQKERWRDCLSSSGLLCWKLRGREPLWKNRNIPSGLNIPHERWQKETSNLSQRKRKWAQQGQWEQLMSYVVTLALVNDTWPVPKESKMTGDALEENYYCS